MPSKVSFIIVAGAVFFAFALLTSWVFATTADDQNCKLLGIYGCFVPISQEASTGWQQIYVNPSDLTGKWFSAVQIFKGNGTSFFFDGVSIVVAKEGSPNQIYDLSLWDSNQRMIEDLGGSLNIQSASNTPATVVFPSSLHPTLDGNSYYYLNLTIIPTGPWQFNQQIVFLENMNGGFDKGYLVMHNPIPSGIPYTLIFQDTGPGTIGNVDMWFQIFGHTQSSPPILTTAWFNQILNQLFGGAWCNYIVKLWGGAC